MFERSQLFGRRSAADARNPPRQVMQNVPPGALPGGLYIQEAYWGPISHLVCCYAACSEPLDQRLVYHA